MGIPWQDIAKGVGKVSRVSLDNIFDILEPKKFELITPFCLRPVILIVHFPVKFDKLARLNGD